MRLKTIVQLGCVTGAAVAPVMADEAADTQAKAIEVLRKTPSGAATILPGSAETTTSDSAYSAARTQRETQLRSEAALKRAARDKAQSEKNAAHDIAQGQRKN